MLYLKAKETKQFIGYLPENPPLYLEHTIEEFLYFVSRLKKVPKTEWQTQKKLIYTMTSLHEVALRRIGNLSKGYQQRVGIAQALVGFPEFIILDEPTTGLDPHQVIEIRELILSLKDAHTILISSHILSEIQAIANRVLILEKGSIIANGTPDELKQKINQAMYTIIHVKGAKDKIEQALNDLFNNNHITTVAYVKEVLSSVWELNIGSAFDIREELFFTFAQHRLPLLLIKPLDISLEDVFLSFTAQQK